MTLRNGQGRAHAEPVLAHGPRGAVGATHADAAISMFLGRNEIVIAPDGARVAVRQGWLGQLRHCEVLRTRPLLSGYFPCFCEVLSVHVLRIAHCAVST